MAKHKRSAPAAWGEIARRGGLGQLFTGAFSCLLGLAALTIAINTATGNGVRAFDAANSSNPGPTSVAPSTKPSATPEPSTPDETTPAPKDETDSDETTDSASTNSSDSSDSPDPKPDPKPTQPTQPTPTPTPTPDDDEPGHGKPPKDPGKPN